MGNITIANNTQTNDSELLAGLNRNVDKSQEITKDIITDALNGSMTIDNRLFTSNGRKDVVNDFKNLGSNLVKATAGAINTAVNPLITAYEVATNKHVGITDVVDNIVSYARIMDLYGNNCY